jgi:hypothetical protein
VAAGVMIKSGMDVKPKVVPPVPVVPIADTADQNVPGVPAQGVIGTLLTVEQMNMALASS